MFIWDVTSFAFKILCLIGSYAISWREITCFLPAEFSFWWCDVRSAERWMLNDVGDWVYTMVYWTLRGFVCASWVVRWRGMNISCANALGDRRVYVEVVWFVSPACMTSSRHVCLRMTSRDLNMLLWFKEARSGVWVGRVMYVIWRNFRLLWAVTVLWSGFFCLLYLRVDCECKWPSFLATVFRDSYFNGDLSQWNVAKVTTMEYSKSQLMFEDDVAWPEHAIVVQGGSFGVWVGGWCM